MTAPLSVTPEQAAQTLGRIRRSTRTFFEEILGIKTLTPDQIAILDAFDRNRRLAITAGQGTGKTWEEAGIALAFLFTRPNSRVITTSSSWIQVKEHLWPELRNMHKNARVPLGGELFLTSLKIDDGWYALGLSTDDYNRLQGFHAPGGVLVIMDEATGIADKIWDAVEAIIVGSEDKVIALGNPTDSTSRFYQECQKEGVSGKKWKHLEISCLNHPNVLTGKPIVPGAVSAEWVDDMRRSYGEDHPVWEARVLGRWSARLGRMFRDFDDELGGRHVFDHHKLRLDPWLPEWVGMDWGYAHSTAAYWFRSDGKHIWVMDELVTAEKTPEELARMVVQRTDGRKLERIVLSFDAMNKTEGPKSKARLMSEVWKPLGMPFPTRADSDRVGGLNLITQLLRTDRISISNRCEKLIEALRRAVRDPDKTEDMLKWDGDDPIDGFRYGVKVWDSIMRVPLDEQLRVALEPAVKSGNPNQRMILHDRFMEKVRVGQRASRPVLPAWQRAAAAIKKRMHGGYNA